MLNIYRASAGAGKTHLLTGEYIKLLFRRDLLPEDADHETQFNEILAVTFTNKSTAEMKERIIQELSLLSREPKESDYYDEIRIDGIGGTLSDSQIQEKAYKSLNDILNNYSDFAVSTIDSFFQKIVRSFARELNLQCNYEVELNSERILNAAVSNFLEKLDRTKRNRLFNWMLKFSEKKLEEGGGWRLERDLQNLVKSVLTSEDYRTRREAIKCITDDKDWLGNYTKKMQEIVSSTIKYIRALGSDGVATLREAGFLATDFKGGIRSKMTIFEKWQSGKVIEPDETLEAWALSDEEWYARTKTKTKTKTSNDSRRLPVEQTVRIKQLLGEAVKMKNVGDFLKYNSAKAILDNIYQLGILADIDKEVNELCSEEGTMLLSTTTELLNRLITVDDAPFVYEKTGTRIHSFMIDEFQDTSHMQWNNFRPLIENSLAEGRQNLIVGDVKQSIYRWRGSDWGLLHSGLKTFAPRQSREDKDTLDTNWRSRREIVRFNSEFFAYASKQLAGIFNDPNIIEIFGDVRQKMPKGKENDVPGAVQVNFIDVGKEEKFEELTMARLPEAVMQLEDAGFQAKDIAILCRTKKLCKMAADSLLAAANEAREKYKNGDEKKYVFDIISNEALMLASRHVIQTIISILRYIQNPSSQTDRTIAACNFMYQCGYNSDNMVKELFNGNTNIERFLEFSNRPLYDMLEGIVSQLPNIGKDIAFVQAFRDCVLEFANGKKADIVAFLDWWEQNKEKLCISTPEGQNAIRIMTIHKSKGLGMPAVILPCVAGTTDMENKGGDILWCQPEVEPFKEENLVLPVKCSKSLTSTIFAKDYEEERLRAIIDNLNTVYVAFTRAKEALVLFSPTPSERAKADSQEVLLKGFCQEYSADSVTTGSTIIYGKISRDDGKDKKGKNNQEKAVVETITQSDNDFLTLRKIPRLALKHNRLLKEVDAIERGNCIHEALSVIIDYDHIDQPIEDLYATGGLSSEYFSCEEMKAELHRLLSQEDVRDWFKPGLRILNEHTIVGITPETRRENFSTPQIAHRPDRIIIDGNKAIVIDYKTGEHQRSHITQVRNYKNLLSCMGFSEVEGYLWYTNPHQIEHIL